MSLGGQEVSSLYSLLLQWGVEGGGGGRGGVASLKKH